MLISTTAITILSSLALAVPDAKSADATRTRRCVIQSSHEAVDDSPAVARVFAQCASDSVIVFQDEVKYNIFQPISATNLSNVECQMNGNLHLPQDIAKVQRIINGTDSSLCSDTKSWFSFAGPEIHYVGSAIIRECVRHPLCRCHSHRLRLRCTIQALDRRSGTRQEHLAEEYSRLQCRLSHFCHPKLLQPGFFADTTRG